MLWERIFFPSTFPPSLGFLSPDRGKQFGSPKRAGRELSSLLTIAQFAPHSVPLLLDAAPPASEMAPAIGSRRLTVLREFRPHGLAAEEADGEGPEARPPQDYDYFLFDPSLAASPAPAFDDEASSSSGADGDHELFIRGNRCACPPSLSLLYSLVEIRNRP